MGKSIKLGDDTYISSDGVTIGNTSQTLSNYLEKQVGAQSNLPDPNKSITENVSGIVESGSNSNGRYVKFADGTMICTRSFRLENIAINTSWGALYESPLCTMGNFAMPFIEVPEVTMSLVGGTFIAPEKLNVTKYGLEPMQFYRPTAGTISSTFSVIAIGKWK